MSIAAYKALYQLLRDPFFWEKTHHGVSQYRAPEFGAETAS
jgi:hypothetical protein